jgi:hypothetical protein
MELRRLSWNTYDLFMGNGFENHSRIRQSKTGVYVMSGQHLPKHVLRELDNTLFNNFPITPGICLEETSRRLTHITWRH